VLRLLADEDFNGRILRGLLLRSPDLDVVRVQDVGLQGNKDESILEWAEHHGRILVTHDARTMPRHARDRIDRGQHLPGVWIVNDQASIGVCIDDILLAADCSEGSEWRDQIYYLPFQ
jgi:hypothetical protein